MRERENETEGERERECVWRGRKDSTLPSAARPEGVQGETVRVDAPESCANENCPMCPQIVMDRMVSGTPPLLAYRREVHCGP